MFHIQHALVQGVCDNAMGTSIGVCGGNVTNIYTGSCVITDVEAVICWQEVWSIVVDMILKQKLFIV